MNTKLTLLPLLSALALLPVMPAGAANACKGLSQQACDGASGCNWVKGYIRKDGREVAPYCRLKSPGKPAAKADAAVPPSTS
jgi:hypothetical protein